MQEIIINSADDGMRLSRWLSRKFPNLKTGGMYKALRNKKIKVNRKRAQADQTLHEGDSILLFLPPDLLSQPETHSKSPAAKHHSEKSLSHKQLDVLYQDEDLLAVYKPAGLLSQKDSAQDQDTLAGRIAWMEKKEGADQVFVPAPAHRLDRNTSGIVLAGRNAAAAARLSQSISSHTMKKYYLTKVHGKFGKKNSWSDIRLLMKKEGNMALVKHPDEESLTKTEESQGWKEALMSVRLLRYDEKNEESWLEIELKTGRFHQIRACLSYLHHPVCGDSKYGNAQPKEKLALQAWKVDLSKTPFSKAGIIAVPDALRIDRMDRTDQR